MGTQEPKGVLPLPSVSTQFYLMLYVTRALFDSKKSLNEIQLTLKTKLNKKKLH